MRNRHNFAAMRNGSCINSSVSETPMVPANFSDLAEKVRPGVVNIQVVKKVKNIGLSPHDFSGGPFGEKNPFDDFFGPFSEVIRPGVFSSRV